jgi:hypothetical protein
MATLTRLGSTFPLVASCSPAQLAIRWRAFTRDGGGFRDLGSRDPGSRDPGSRDPGSRDPGSRDPGSRDRDRGRAHGRSRGSAPARTARSGRNLREPRSSSLGRTGAPAGARTTRASSRASPDLTWRPTRPLGARTLPLPRFPLARKCTCPSSCPPLSRTKHGRSVLRSTRPADVPPGGQSLWVAAVHLAAEPAGVPGGQAENVTTLSI